MNDNERYYYEFGRADWNGTFNFRITNWGAFLRAPNRITDKGGALFLDAVSRLSKSHVTSRLWGSPSSDEVKAWLVVKARWVLPISFKLFELHGHYRLDEDGTRVTGELYEQYGPLPFLLDSESSTTAVIGDQGLSATYERTLFGTHWQGRYTITTDEQRVRHVTAVYTDTASAWGELDYQVISVPLFSSVRTLPRFFPVTLGPPKPTADRDRVLVLARKLRDRAKVERARGSRIAVFTELYAQETFLIADAIGAPRVELPQMPRNPLTPTLEAPLQFDIGVEVAGEDAGDEPRGGQTIHADGRFFDDPAWIAKLATNFANRYLAAVEGFDKGQYVPPLWKNVLETLERGELSELEALAVCIHSHIAGDLPFALAETGDLDAHVDDYDRCNRLLAGDIDDSLEAFWQRNGRFYRYLEALGARFEARFTAEWIRQLRNGAWYDGIRLQRDPAAIEPWRRKLERKMAERVLLDTVDDFLSDVLDPAPWPVGIAALFVRKVADRLRKRASSLQAVAR